MILKLEQIPKRTLEIEKPDGESIQLTLKKFPLKSLPELEKQTKELEKLRVSGKIDTREYYHKMNALIVEDYNPDELDDLDVEHISLISQKIQELKANKPEAEKKSLGR